MQNCCSTLASQSSVASSPSSAQAADARQHRCMQQCGVPQHCPSSPCSSSVLGFSTAPAQQVWAYQQQLRGKYAAADWEWCTACRQGLPLSLRVLISAEPCWHGACTFWGFLLQHALPGCPAGVMCTCLGGSSVHLQHCGSVPVGK
jgi:hypothetical protein